MTRGDAGRVSGTGVSQSLRRCAGPEEPGRHCSASTVLMASATVAGGDGHGWCARSVARVGEWGSDHESLPGVVGEFHGEGQRCRTEPLGVGRPVASAPSVGVTVKR